MNVQLLLLVALAGPFCAFTHASPTVNPTDANVAVVTDVISAATDAPKEELSVVTGAPTTEPAVAPEVHATEVVTEAAPDVTVANTEAAVVETETPPAVTAGPQLLSTDAPVVETAAPTVAAEVDDQPEATAPAKAEAEDGVVVEDELDGGLSSGQVVGIVIGALLAVVIVIAVVIAVVRRMGKYSSAKNKKPTKKDSVMVSPLKKKSAKQQERPRFWKF